MSGNKEGGQAAAATNKRKYGEDFYKKIGKHGGMARNPFKGFGGDSDRAREAGAKGGRNGSRKWTEEQRKAHGLIMRRVHVNQSKDSKLSEL